MSRRRRPIWSPPGRGSTRAAPAVQQRPARAGTSRGSLRELRDRDRVVANALESSVSSWSPRRFDGDVEVLQDLEKGRDVPDLRDVLDDERAPTRGAMPRAPAAPRSCCPRGRSSPKCGAPPRRRIPLHGERSRMIPRPFSLAPPGARALYTRAPTGGSGVASTMRGRHRSDAGACSSKSGLPPLGAVGLNAQGPNSHRGRADGDLPRVDYPSTVANRKGVRAWRDDDLESG